MRRQPANKAPCVSRRYHAAADDCTRAVELLLERPGKKEAVLRQNGPDDAKGKSKNDSHAKTSIP